ncbi:hypothetical protein HG535_0A07560 [Zygotorulaspora mrakii]|uniref:Arp2/3 complex 34 kDa subunit n=1 Tax=Zygotorulaspora mrakii TaxID=42260 RepID=A0A7H9AXI9_ZYGMR|nr:uncharacterized protein HG535_0A07560 [Zygotorulaspora mrakii]QLG70814.1 hypothetical protein HG535_0A07560 [Zygotorulaspora mrakii]
MLHLQPNNLLIQKTLSEAIEAYGNGTPLTLDRIISDFDYTTFHISNASEDKLTLALSIRTKAWQSVSQCTGGPGLVAYLQSKYANYSGISASSVPESGYDYTLLLDLGKLQPEAMKDLSLLKTLVLGYAFQLAFNEFVTLSAAPEGTESETNILHTIKYRDDENLFIKPSYDRITVIFETIFQDETDKVFGKVFLQEFVDARKRNRSIQSAPQVLFSHEPPLELQNAGAVASMNSSDTSRRFITFVLFPRHFQTPELQFSTLSHLTLFRNYFHYHIKCSKAYMHSRMRYRVDSFIKVLNRAKLDEEEEDIDQQSKQQQTRRTITGRKMVSY